MKKWDKNDSKSKSMDNKIAEMIVLDDLLFTHVEDLGFQRLMEEASPQYVLKQRKFYRDLICEEMYSSVASKIESTVSSLLRHAMDHLQLMNGLTAHLEFLFYPSRIMQCIKTFKGKTLY